MDQSPAAAETALLVAWKLVFDIRALIRAVIIGDTETVVNLLDRGVPINAKDVDDEGNSLLHWAAKRDHVTTMRLLIRRGCDVDSVDGRGLTPLHLAAAMGQIKAVQELIWNGASKSMVADTFGTPLHQAAIKGYVETVIAMLKEGCPFNVVNSDGSTVLHFAAVGGHVEVVRELVGRGCDVNAVEASGCTPLHSAAGCDRAELEKCASMANGKRVTFDNFMTPFHQALLNKLANLKVGHLSIESAILHSITVSGLLELFRGLVSRGEYVGVVCELVDKGCDLNAVNADGFTPLHNAAFIGRVEVVRALIKLGANKSVVAGEFGTPLHLAALKGHVETVEAMLEEGCPFDVVDSDGSTVLHVAAEGGHVEVVRELVVRGCNVNAVAPNGHTPLHSAAGCGRTEAVRELKILGATMSVVAGEFGTPLHQAVLKGHVETAVAMLEEGCPIDVVNSERATVLHFAAAGGHVELLKELVGRGCDVNAMQANGHTPLHSAAGYGRTEAVLALIKLGAIKSVVAGNCDTPLHQAALKGHVETVVAMVEEGFPLDAADRFGFTVLHWAAGGGNVEVVRVLVDRGCDINVVGAFGCTPLHLAAVCSRIETFRELIKCGASKSAVTGECGTPLHVATLRGHEAVVAMLEEGCPIDVVDNDGATVLHWAAQCGQVEVVRELVGRGCDLNAVKADGCTPLHSAAMCGKTEAVCELIKLGATISVDASVYGTPLHQAVINGDLKTVEVLLGPECYELDVTEDNATSLKAPTAKYNVITTCASFGVTPVMSAVLFGQVEMVKFLTSIGAAFSDRDTFSVSTLEHCFIGGQASKLSQFCEACGIGSSGEGLRGALATLIIQGLVDAHKVLCLCAFSGDSVFLEDQFIELVASDACAMPAAVKCAKYYFYKGVPFINQLRIPDEYALNPLQMSLLSLKCFKMGFAIGSVERGTKDHTSFITKLVSHPVLKKTVNQHFPNGLSPLDLAQQFELHDIAALIERAGGCPGVCMGAPQGIKNMYPLELAKLNEVYPYMCSMANSEAGREYLIKWMSSFPGVSLYLSSWNKEAAATVGADVGAETDDHEYKSLMKRVEGVNQPLDKEVDVIHWVNDNKCRIAINAMLNHHNGGIIHFGISDNGKVEEGLKLPLNHAIDELRKTAGKVRKTFYPKVDDRYVQVEPVKLQDDMQRPTGQWRFDIIVKPHRTVVLFGEQHPAYYRGGNQSNKMSYAQLADKVRAERASHGH